MTDSQTVISYPVEPPVDLPATHPGWADRRLTGSTRHCSLETRIGSGRPVHIWYGNRLAPRARKDIEAAVEAGRFDIENAQLGLMAAGGALLGLLQLLDADREADAAMLTDQMTARVLRAFGMTKREAEKLCARPMPPQPAL
jgi:hypothetical protein